MHRPAKKLWSGGTRWQHDRYDAHSQAPKSRAEIVATYGFDIRTVQDGRSLSAGTRSGRKTRYVLTFSCFINVLKECILLVDATWEFKKNGILI